MEFTCCSIISPVASTSEPGPTSDGRATPDSHLQHLCPAASWPGLQQMLPVPVGHGHCVGIEAWAWRVVDRLHLGILQTGTGRVARHFKHISYDITMLERNHFLFASRSCSPLPLPHLDAPAWTGQAWHTPAQRVPGPPQRQRQRRAAAGGRRTWWTGGGPVRQPAGRVCHLG